MPATSKSQRRLMGMAYAYKIGKLKGKNISDKVKELSKSMSIKDLEDFAETKHKGLPNKVKRNKKKMNKEQLKKTIKEEITNILSENYKDEVKTLYTQFDEVKKAIKGTSVSLLDIWINLGLTYKLIDNEDVSRLLDEQEVEDKPTTEE